MAAETVIPVAYVTKWALSRGIVKVTGARLSPASDGGTEYLVKGYIFESRKHWTTDLEEAQARARKMAGKRAAALKKQAVVMAEKAANDFEVIDFDDL